MKNQLLATATVIVAVVLSLAGTVMSNELLKIHGGSTASGTAFEDSWWSQLCGADAGSAGGCQDVVGSRHGMLTLPGIGLLPVALLAQWYYTFVGLWFLFVGAPHHGRRWWHVIPTVGALGATAASAYYIYIMSVELHQWCNLCLILHGIDFVLLGAIMLLWFAPLKPRTAGPLETEATDVPAPRSGGLVQPLERLVFCTLACVVACSFVWYLWFAYALQNKTHTQQLKRYTDLLQDMSEDRAVVYGAFLGSTPVAIPPRTDAPRLGPADATHELVIFSDLQCSSCRKFEQTLREQIMPSLGDHLSVIFRHFPLCTDCNPSQTPSGSHRRGIHPQACQAAYAAEAAGVQRGQSGFWEMHDLIVSRQADLFAADFSLVRYEVYARELGLDVERFRADMASDNVRETVKGDVSIGIDLGVRGTPTVFLDGKRLRPIQRGSEVFWQTVVAAILEADRTPESGG